MIPWTILGALVKFFAPNLPDILAAVKNLKRAQQRETIILDDTSARVLELEQRLAAQLQVLDQVTAQFVKLEKAFAWALWASLFAAVLSLIALGLVFFK